jgi:prophage maintenance system killer protein
MQVEYEDLFLKFETQVIIFIYLFMNHTFLKSNKRWPQPIYTGIDTSVL